MKKIIASALFVTLALMIMPVFAAMRSSTSVPYSLNITNNNVGLGPNSLLNVTTGIQNIAVGINAGTGVTVGTQNVLIVNNESLLVDGSNNVLMGIVDVVGAHNNEGVAIGIGSVVGFDDVAIGYNPMFHTTTGSQDNVAIGGAALYSNPAGVGNIGIGAGAAGQLGVTTSSGNYNVVIGRNADTLQISGDSNLVLGDSVNSDNLYTGSHNIFLGVSSAIHATTTGESNAMHIGGTGGDWATITGTNVQATQAAVLNGKLTATGLISGGTKFTMTGCSATAPVGGAVAGTYTSGTTGTCTVVITMNGATGLASPTGWDCHASDRTTVADLQQTTTSSTTTATISGATLSGDVISFNCTGY